MRPSCGIGAPRVTPPILELQDVTKRFGSQRAPIWALDGVSLALQPGETLGVVGESGSGKSTIARIAAGLETPSAGTVLIEGRKVRRGGSGLLQMVFQDPASSLDPSSRIRRSVREPLDADRCKFPAGRDGRALAALAEVGLGREFAERYPVELSGGQKQRASIARALAALPPVIICDEAVTALDVSIRAQILNLLRGVQDEHAIACLFISHDLCTVAYMSHRIAVMYLGKIVEIGSTAQLLARPAHPYTSVLFSAVPRLQQGARARLPIRIKGDPPSITRKPSGCRFHTRCPLADSKCRGEEPLLRVLEPAHLVACHYAPADEATLAAASGAA